MTHSNLENSLFLTLLLCLTVSTTLFGSIDLAAHKAMNTTAKIDKNTLSNFTNNISFFYNELPYESYQTDDYCVPQTTNSPSQRYINQLRFIGTLNDTSNSSTYATDSNAGYQDFTGLSNHSSQSQNEGINIYAQANARGRWKAWVDWNKDGIFDEATETVYNPGAYAGVSVSFGFVIPENVTPGNYRLRVRVYNSFTTVNSSTVEYFNYNFSACETFDSRTTFYSGQERTFNEFGEAEDYTFTVLPACNAQITETIEGETCGSGTVDLAVSASEDVTEYRWYSAATGGNLLATTTTGYWTTPNLTTTTPYYVTAYNGSCESYVRTEVVANITPIPTLNFTPETPVVCGEDDILTLQASGDLEQIYLIDEDFETGGLGVFSNINNDSNTADYDIYSQWQNYTSTIIPEGKVWFPAIASGFGDNKFVLANSDLINSPAPNDIDNSLTLNAAVNTQDFIDLTLDFDVFYSRYLPNNNESYQEYFAVEISTDNGISWTTTLSYKQDIGIGTNFENISLDLSAYTEVEQLKLRFKHYSYSNSSGWLPDGVAIDNIKLYGSRPLNTAFNWISDTPVDAYIDEACTTPYTEGTPVNTVYIKPTLSQLEQEAYTFTASATLSNSCYANTSITVENTTRVWQGNSPDWSDPNNWLPAYIPTTDNCVIIKDSDHSDLLENTRGYAKNFKVKNNGDFTIQNNAALTVEEELMVEENGTFHIENNGSLVQINETENTGIITMNRNSIVSLYDYVYWSSPVSDFNVTNISPSTSLNFIFQWIPTINGSVGNWSNFSGEMVLGKGYIVRAPSGFPIATSQNHAATFSGTPNNGTITTSISRGNYTGENYLNSYGNIVTNMDDNFNLVGNPYPSAIDAKAFLIANENLEGNIQVWTHGEAPNQNNATSFYSNYLYNYNQEDYIVYNATGTSAGPETYNGYIGAGQGFFVQMVDGAEITANVTFSNAMRSDSFDNSQFYRISQPVTTPSLEEGRFWIDLITPAGNTSRTLIGYMEGATNNKDRIFDSYTINNPKIFSLLNNKKMEIQGRALPFNETDSIPLGFVATTSGTYTIAIAALDGFFNNTENQTIYLEDTYLNTYHNLNNNPYTFTVEQANTFTDRFIIRYQDQSALSTEDFTTGNNVQLVSLKNNTIKVSATKDMIQEITIYNVEGKKLAYFKNSIQSKSVELPFHKTNSVLLVTVTTSKNHHITKKIIH